MSARVNTLLIFAGVAFASCLWVGGWAPDYLGISLTISVVLAGVALRLWRCLACREGLRGDSKFCPHCGARLKQDDD